MLEMEWAPRHAHVLWRETGLVATVLDAPGGGLIMQGLWIRAAREAFQRLRMSLAR